MKTRWAILLVVSLLALGFVPGAASQSQNPQVPPADTSAVKPVVKDAKQSEAYYQFALASLYDELYESTAGNEYASLAIEAYKKAYELDPRASVIGEKLAEMYAKSNRIRDAVLEAQDIIKRDPGNVGARRLLARIYLHSLGERNRPQDEMRDRAIEQFREIVRLDPKDFDSALMLARLYRMENNLTDAEQTLRNILSIEPENEPALEQLTRLLLDTGRASEAVKLLEDLAERSPSARILGALGEAYAKNQDYAKAETAFRKADQLDPDDRGIVGGLAESLLAQEKLDAAREQYERLIELQPEAAENYLRLSLIYRRLNQLDRAEEYLLRARERSPGNLEVIYNEALLYEAQGRYQDAIRVMSDAVAAFKRQSRGDSGRRTLAVLYEQLGRLYREVEDYTSAVNTYREMESLGVDQDRRSRLLVIDALRAAKQMDQALEEAVRARQLYPNDPAIDSAYAMLLAENGDTEQAEAILRGMLQNSASDRDIYLQLAQVYERGRRYDDAVAAVLQAVRLNQGPADNENAWFLLGAINERRGDFRQAETYFAKVLDVNPNNAQALNYLGYMLAERNTRLDEAVSLIQRALHEDPHNGAYLDSLGWAYFQQKNYVEAEKSLRLAIERIGSDPTVREHLGDVLYATNRHREAAAQWEKALDLWSRALPAERDTDQIASIESKLASVKARLAQSGTPTSKP